MVGQIAGYPLNANAADTIVGKDPPGSLCAGQTPLGILGGVFFESGIDPGTGNQRKIMQGRISTK